MSVDLVYSDTVSDLDDWAIYADMKMGDWDMWGAPQYSVGTEEDYVGDYTYWDYDPMDGIDSGWLDFSFRMKTGSETSVTWTIDSSGPVVYAGAEYGNIVRVDIRAVVQMPDLRFTFSTLYIEFFRDGVLTETIDLYNMVVSADTTVEGSTAQHLLTIIPSNPNNDEVYITGQFNLHAGQGTWPGAADIFGEVLVYTA